MVKVMKRICVIAVANSEDKIAKNVNVDVKVANKIE
jgi:hypothetical protein